jgi:hypothetical protein
MNKEDVEQLLAKALVREDPCFKHATAEEWTALQGRLGTNFPDEFLDLMGEFRFPGEIYNVTRTAARYADDTIEIVYSLEKSESKWPEDLIPFYGIGNGDYFALSRAEGAQTAVYFRRHEDGFVEKVSDTFSAWLSQLPSFLTGH